MRLSLVTVPVKAFPAISSGGEIRLNQLHAECNQRVKYQKTCPEHGAISNDQIVSGYEHSKGQYVVVQQEELQKLRPERDGTIRIEGFLDAGEVDSIYHAGRAYYLLPNGAVGQKPYSLLFQSMTDDGVEAIAQVVLSGREHLVLLRPYQRMLTMFFLTHQKKVNSVAHYHEELEEHELSDEELALTKTLIGASRIAEFDYAKYEDDYVEQLNRLIQAKIEGHEIVEVKDAEEPKILNLMEALKKSVAQAQLG